MIYWELLVTILVAITGSSGVWGYITLKVKRNDSVTKMLIGMAQHQILAEGKRLLDQGYVTTDEYRNLDKGLYKPYVELGGNGLAEKIMKEIDKLPMKRSTLD